MIVEIFHFLCCLILLVSSELVNDESLEVIEDICFFFFFGYPFCFSFVSFGFSFYFAISFDFFGYYFEGFFSIFYSSALPVGVCSTLCFSKAKNFDNLSHSGFKAKESSYSGSE